MSATSIDLSQIKTDALSAASTFRTLIGLGSSATLNAGSANGVATLDALGKLAAAQIPDISLISYLGSVASQAAMLALTGQQGDWCVRSDLSTTWVITGSDPTLLANWTQLSYPSVPVQSVFGRTGNVVGVSTDYSSVGITNTAIGASNPSTGAFTTLSANSGTFSTGTITASTPAIDISQTWNNNAVAFTGMKFNATNTASSSSSLLADWQVDGITKVRIKKDGTITFKGAYGYDAYIGPTSAYSLIVFGDDLILQASYGFYLNGNPSVSGYLGIGSGNINLYGEANNVLALRKSTNAQTFRLYNTTDAGLTNYERAKIAWSSNVLQIGTEKLGTGSARALELQTDGTTRLTISTTGVATIPNTLDLTIRTVTYGATMAIDASLGNKIAITLTGNGTISNPTNAVDGRVLVFRLRQDATGSRIPVWDTKYSFVGDLATVTLSTAANKIDRVAFEYDSTDDKWYCISFIKGS